MEDQSVYWSVADLIRRGLFDSRESIQRLVKMRRFPAPRKIGGRALWKRATIEQWYRDGAIIWIQRRHR